MVPRPKVAGTGLDALDAGARLALGGRDHNGQASELGRHPEHPPHREPVQVWRS